MIKHNQDGAANGLMISFVFCVMLLVGAIGFGGWAYTQMIDYRDNVDQKVSVAEQAAKAEQSAVKDKQFAEQSKNPLKLYKGPEAYGSLEVNYPRTWSGYVDDKNSSNPVDGYFNPNVVPSINDQKSVFALRVQVVSQSYSQTLQSFSGQQQNGKLKVSAYALPKMPKQVGVMATGEISDGKNVTMVVLPLRSQTLKIWTEGSQSTSDFNKFILPNFSFSP